MRVASPSPRGWKARVRGLFENTLFRYLFAVVLVGSTFALRLWLIPLTGTGAPFVLFFAAVLVTSLFAGAGPGLLGVLLSVPFAVFEFVLRAGYPVLQASFQSLLFAVDGLVVVYLTHVMTRGRRALEGANRDLSNANEARQVYVSLLDNASDFIGITDPRGKPIYLNPAGRKMVGLPADHPIEETHVLDYHPPSERAFAADVIIKSVLERGHWSGETLLRHWQTGASIPVSEEHFMIRDRRSDRVLGMGAIARDLSEARRSREREQLLAREQQARQQAEAASRLRDQVLAIVAHDLRNPLGTILMQAAALKRSGSESETEVIYRAAARMNRLIQDLLDVALAQAGELTIKRERISSRELLVETVAMQRPLASSSRIELGLELEGDVPAALGDHDRLLQVFENLIGNAIKFTHPDGHITVGAAARAPDVLFWVSDTGRGIAPESLPHIFDRFWQATAGDERPGAGLGLSITKAIVEAHGGRIWVESTLGRGTTFFFSIPEASPAEDRRADSMHQGL